MTNDRSFEEAIKLVEQNLEKLDFAKEALLELKGYLVKKESEEKDDEKSN